MRCFLTGILVVGLASITCVALASAEPPPREDSLPAEETVSQSSTTVYRLRPDEISHYSIAQSFFLRAHHMAQTPHGSQPFQRLLSELKLPEDPETKEFLLTKVENGVAIIRTPQIDPELEGEAYDEHQFNTLREKADRLGTTFRELLDGLMARGIGIAGILAYCEEQIRPTISVTTTDLAGDSYFWVAVSVFDQHLVGLEGHDQ